MVFHIRVDVDETIIIGTKGQISFAVFVPSAFTITTSSGTQTVDLGYPAHVHQPMVENIIAELNGNGQCPSTGETAAHTNWVFDQIFADFQQRS